VGDAIPLGARILAVVDCFDALTSDRPYRPRLDDHEAMKILTDRRASMYDPRVVDVFVELHAATSRDAEPAAATKPPTADPHRPQLSQTSVPARTALDLETFYDLGRALEVPASDSQIGGTLWAHLERHLPASAFVLFMYEEASDSLVARYQAGEPTLAADSHVPLGQRLSGWVAAARQPIVNSDARLDLDEDVREESLLRSVLAVPVTRGERIVGVLAFYARSLDAFTDVHRRIAEAASYVSAESIARLDTREGVGYHVKLSRRDTVVSRSGPSL
jgi:GAF domain-containing protein